MLYDYRLHNQNTIDIDLSGINDIDKVLLKIINIKNEILFENPAAHTITLNFSSDYDYSEVDITIGYITDKTQEELEIVEFKKLENEARAKARRLAQFQQLQAEFNDV